MSNLEKTTHIFLISVCAVSLTVLVKQNFMRNLLGHAPAPSGQAALTRLAGQVVRKDVGDSLTVPGASWKHSRMNLVIALRSDCPYCAASLPLYRKISDLARSSNKDVSVVAVSSESPATVKNFLSKAQVRLDGVYQSDLAPLGIPGTPTIVVVDHEGIIQQLFVGELPEARQKVLLAMSFPSVR